MKLNALHIFLLVVVEEEGKLQEKKQNELVFEKQGK